MSCKEIADNIIRWAESFLIVVGGMVFFACFIWLPLLIGYIFESVSIATQENTFIVFKVVLIVCVSLVLISYTYRYLKRELNEL